MRKYNGMPFPPQRVEDGNSGPYYFLNVNFLIFAF